MPIAVSNIGEVCAKAYWRGIVTCIYTSANIRFGTAADWLCIRVCPAAYKVVLVTPKARNILVVAVYWVGILWSNNVSIIYKDYKKINIVYYIGIGLPRGDNRS